jgi:hypothetical protein
MINGLVNEVLLMNLIMFILISLIELKREISQKTTDSKFDYHRNANMINGVTKLSILKI